MVDAANYVMLEIGQPLHTYDYDKIDGHSLTCRHAEEGEKIVTSMKTRESYPLPILLLLMEAIRLHASPVSWED